MMTILAKFILVMREMCTCDIMSKTSIQVKYRSNTGQILINVIFYIALVTILSGGFRSVIYNKSHNYETN